jgi:hypothetical protein
MVLRELYISPGCVGQRRGGTVGGGGRLAMNLGPQIFAWEGNKKKKTGRKKTFFNGISKYLLLCSRLCPQGAIWRKEGGGGKESK